MSHWQVVLAALRTLFFLIDNNWIKIHAEFTPLAAEDVLSNH